MPHSTRSTDTFWPVMDRKLHSSPSPTSASRAPYHEGSCSSTRHWQLTRFVRGLACRLDGLSCSTCQMDLTQ